MEAPSLASLGGFFFGRLDLILHVDLPRDRQTDRQKNQNYQGILNFTENYIQTAIYSLQVEECERALKEAGEMTDALQESFKMVRRYSRFMSDEELIRLLEIIFAFVGIRDFARMAVTIVSKISSETGWDLFKLM